MYEEFAKAKIYYGDCLDILKQVEESSIDSLVTDPPYGISFMGKEWDHGVPGKIFWEEALRVVKPGAHLLAFGGTRTFHRLTCAIEDAGWDIRDCLMWVYGSGFPKSLDMSKAIDKEAGATREVIGSKIGLPGYSLQEYKGQNIYSSKGRSSEVECIITSPSTEAAKEWSGWGTALKPAWEPIILARKPFDSTVAKNVQRYGTGALNINECRVPHVTVDGGNLALNPHLREKINGGNGGHIFSTEEERRVVIPNTNGRFPANFIHDGSEEVTKLFPITKSGAMKREVSEYNGESITSFLRGRSGPSNQHGDSGSAARFFYCAKASKKERGQTNTHPTVKPQALMQYLCRLITPPNGIILDMFMGSGSTIIAALAGGFHAIGIELEKDSYEISKKRIIDSIGVMKFSE